MEIIPCRIHRRRQAGDREEILLPRQLEENGIRPGKITMRDKRSSPSSTNTRGGGAAKPRAGDRPGVPETGRKIAEGRRAFVITPKSLAKYLGAPRNLRNGGGGRRVGVATGLAWTPTGGDILFVEVSSSTGRDP